MTSSWRHKFCIIYLLCSKYMPSFKFMWSLQVCVFVDNLSGEEEEEELEVKCLSWQTLGVRVNCRFNEVSSLWRHNHILENAWRLLWWQYQFHLQNTYTFCVRMCCKKRTVYLNTVQEYTMALSCVMTSVIFLKSYMSKSICTETMLKLSQHIGSRILCKLFFLQLTVCTMVQIVNLFLLVVDMIFWNFLNFDVGFGQEVKVKMGSPFCKYFWKLTICTIVQKIVNLRLLVVEICFFLMLNFDFWFGQEVKVKLGHFFYKYFLTINDLYNGAKILNLPLVVVEIWLFLYITLWLPVWTGSKCQIGVTFL